MSRPRRVILTVINDLTGDQRIHRIASTLQQAGFEVWVVGRKLPESLPIEGRAYHTHRMRLFFRRGKAFYLEYNLRLLLFLLFTRFDIINANDLDTLLATFIASRLKRAELIYDSHEYFTEVPELINRRLTRHIWLRLERWLFPRLRKAYTVNSSIAAIYTQKYEVKVGVVRNLPTRKAATETADPERRILLYQGALNIGRGIELMIAAMAFLPEYRLWIVGKGDVDRALREQAHQQDLLERVSFLGFVPLEQLHSITMQASLGLSLEEDMGASYRYASPNKVHDYIQAGIPVLVSDLPEMRKVVEKHGVGSILSVDRRSPELLAAEIRRLHTDVPTYLTYARNCRRAAGELNWEAERHRLLEIYGG